MISIAMVVKNQWGVALDHKIRRPDLRRLRFAARAAAFKWAIIKLSGRFGRQVSYCVAREPLASCGRLSRSAGLRHQILQVSSGKLGHIGAARWLLF